MILYTAQYRTHDRDRVDITRAGCERALRLGQPTPGIFLAPSSELLRRGLAERRAAKTDAEKVAAWERYAADYRAEMLTSYSPTDAFAMRGGSLARRWKRPGDPAHHGEWEAFLGRERLVFCCFCSGEDAAAQRCHRFLAAAFFSKLGADYRGELRPEDVIAPPPDVEPPPDLFFGAQHGRHLPFMTTDGRAVGHITMDRPRRRRCNACGALGAELLCDFPVRKKNRKSTTCDAPLCGSCARTVGPDQHHCPKHAAAPTEAARA